MGYPTFYYYKEERGPLTVVSFGRPISDVYQTPMRERADAVGGNGSPVHRVGAALATVTIRRERCTDLALVRQWRDVEDHLLAGGRVGFSWDHAKTWAAYASGPLVIGQTIAYTYGNAFTAWSSSAALANGDELAIEEPNPYGRRRTATVSSVTAGQVSLGEAFGNDFEHGCMVRYHRFWPSLYLPEELIRRTRITSDRGLIFGLDLTLAVDPAILQRATWDGTPAGGPDLGLRSSTAGASSVGMSLEALTRGSVGVGGPSASRKPGV